MVHASHPMSNALVDNIYHLVPIQFFSFIIISQDCCQKYFPSVRLSGQYLPSLKACHNLKTGTMNANRYHIFVLNISGVAMIKHLVCFYICTQHTYDTNIPNGASFHIHLDLDRSFSPWIFHSVQTCQRMERAGRIGSQSVNAATSMETKTCRSRFQDQSLIQNNFMRIKMFKYVDQ